LPFPDSVTTHTSIDHIGCRRSCWQRGGECQRAAFRRSLSIGYRGTVAYRGNSHRARRRPSSLAHARRAYRSCVAVAVAVRDPPDARHGPDCGGVLDDSRPPPLPVGRPRRGVARRRRKRFHRRSDGEPRTSLPGAGCPYVVADPLAALVWVSAAKVPIPSATVIGTVSMRGRVWQDCSSLLVLSGLPAELLSASLSQVEVCARRVRWRG